MVGNHSMRVMADASLPVRLTSLACTTVGLSDSVVPHRWAIAQRIKATPGITGLSPPRVHIDGEVWYLAVGSSHPGAVVGPKGWAVRPLKRYASWVQNVVRHFGPFTSWALEVCVDLTLVLEDRNGHTVGVPVVRLGASLGSYV